MKIIFIPHLPTLFGRRYNLAKSLAEQGHEVHFIVWDMPYPLTPSRVFNHVANSWKSKRYEDSSNLFIHQVRRLPFFWPFINGIIFKYQIKKIYKDEDAQLIISQAFTNETEPPLKLPLVYDINDDHQAFADIYGSNLYRFGYKLLGVKSVITRQTSKALLVTVVSNKLETFAKKYNANVIKIANGVESEALMFSQKNRAKPKHHSITYVSTFGKWSQLYEAIEAIYQLKNTYPDIHLNLIGEGTELEKAKQQAKRLNLKKYVTFYGKITDRRKVYELIAGADICLNISEKNSFRDAASPIKIFEYSALGKVIVSTNVDEVVSLKLPNVIIYKPDSEPGQLAGAILKAFKLHRDNSDVQKRIANDYNWDNLANQMLKNVQGSKA